MAGEVRLELTYEVASALVKLAEVVRAEERHEMGLQKTVRASKGVTAAMKEMADQAKSLDQIRAAMAAGDERRLKARLSALEQEAQAQSRLRSIEAQRLGALGQQRLDHYTARQADAAGALGQQHHAHRMAVNLALANEEMRKLPALTKEQERALKGLEQPAKAASAATVTMGQSLRMGISDLAMYAAGWVGIQTVIQGATVALEEHTSRLERSRAGGMSLGEAQAQFLLNVAGTPMAQASKAMDALSAGGIYSKPEQMTLAGAKAAAAYGGDPAAAVSYVMAAERLALGKPELLEAMSVGGLGMSKATGRADPQFNIGLGLLIGQHARPEDPSLQARNVAQALSRAAPYSQGDREKIARQGGAIFAAMTQMGEDVAGEEAAGAYYRVQQQMREHFGKWGIEDPQYPLARLELLRSRPDLAREFMEHAEFGHQRFKSTFEEFFFGGDTSPARKFLREGLAGIEGGDPLGVYAATERRLGSTGPLRQLQRTRKSEASSSRAALRTPEEILANAVGVRNQTMADTRKYSGIWQGLGLAYAAERGGGAIDYFNPFNASDQWTENRIRFMRTELFARRGDILTPDTGLFGPQGVPRRPDQLNYTERQDLKNVEEQLGILNDMLQELRQIRQNRAVEAVTASVAVGVVEASLPMH